MFDHSKSDSDGIDIEKTAQDFQQQYPDAPPEAAAIFEDLMQLQARLDDVEKGRRQKREALREELEADIGELEGRLEQVTKAITGSAPSTSGDADERATERAAIEKEHEVFTR